MKNSLWYMDVWTERFGIPKTPTWWWESKVNANCNSRLYRLSIMDCNIENRLVPGYSFIFFGYSFILIIRLDISHEPTFIIHSCLRTFNFYMPSYLSLFLFAKVEPTSKSSGTNTITTYRNKIQFEHNSLYWYVFLDLVFSFTT